jgi:RTX calcium-binding nonapeptide repeat (4 copies)
VGSEREPLPAGWEAFTQGFSWTTLHQREEQNLPSDYYGQDYLDGDDGDDYLQGGGSHDMLIGGLGADTLFGDGQNAQMEPFSAHGEDTLQGGDGNDVVIGGGEIALLGGVRAGALLTFQLQPANDAFLRSAA